MGGGKPKMGGMPPLDPLGAATDYLNSLVNSIRRNL